MSLVPPSHDSGLIQGQVSLAGLGWNGSYGCKVKQGGENLQVSCGMSEFMTNSLETAVTARDHVTENKDLMFIYQFISSSCPKGELIEKRSCLKLIWLLQAHTPPSLPAAPALVALLLPKTFRLLYGKHELLLQLLIALVWGEVQAIKACVASWKPVLLANFLNAELLGAVASHQVGESAHRKTTGSCNKLQQSHPLLVVHLLHKLPEPQDLFATSGIMPVDCVSLPVHQVYLLHPTQHHL